MMNTNIVVRYKKIVLIAGFGVACGALLLWYVRNEQVVPEAETVRQTIVVERPASDSDMLDIIKASGATKPSSNMVQEEKEIFVTNGIRHSIPLEEILVGIGGGSGRNAILNDRLPKDAIPSIDNPEFEDIGSANAWLQNDDPGIAYSASGVHRFYPFRILVQHEIVNDTLPSGDRVLVTYCPLCLTGFAVDPLVQGERVEFGVSGLLWKSNLIMYDRKTETLWSQVLTEAIVGEETGQQLTILPSDVVQYGNWKAQHQNGQVLSRNTGFFGRQYTGNVYGGSYFDLPQASKHFTQHQDNRLAEDAVVYGVVINGNAKAYSVSSVKSKGVVEDAFEGIPFVLRHNDDLDVVRMFRKTEEGEERISPVSGFWFSWSAAYPSTALYK